MFNPIHNISTFQPLMNVPHFEMPSTDTMVRNSLNRITNPTPRFDSNFSGFGGRPGGF